MAGVGDSTTVDVVTHDPVSGDTVLIMAELRNWGKQGYLLPDLQEKFKTYLHFVESGQLDEKFPKLKGKPVRIRLECKQPPGPMEREFLRRIQDLWLKPAHVALEVGVYPRSPKGK